MSFANINAVIASLANATSVTIVEHDRAPIVKGRRALPTATLTVVTEVVHHPDTNERNVATRDAVRSEDRAAFYFRTEVLPARANPNGNDPWWVILDGANYQIDAVENWRAGGFWVARGSRIATWPTSQPVAFASLDRSIAASSNAAILAAILAGSTGYADSRSFRVAMPATVADGPSSYDDADFTYDDSGVTYDGDGLICVGLAWHSDIDAVEDSPTFRAMLPSGETQEVTPLVGPATATISGQAWTFVLLPSYVDADDVHRYEVVG